MPHNSCPTVNVVANNEQGFMIINLSDFDEAVHKLFGEASTAADTKAAKAKQKAEAAEAAAKAQAAADAEKERVAKDTIAAQAAGQPLMVQAPWLKPDA